MGNDPNQGTVHHRLAKADGGHDISINRVQVRRNKHEAYHLLFGTGKPQEIAKILTDTWIHHKWRIIAVRR